MTEQTQPETPQPQVDEKARKKLLKKAKKLYELALRGVDGEKETAQKMLTEFLEKHGIDTSEVETKNIKKRTYPVKSYEEELILTNVILSVNPFVKINTAGNATFVELDEEDHAEVKTKFTYFMNIWNIEKRMLTDAFFSKHAQFFQPDDRTRDKYAGENNRNSALDKAQQMAEKLEKKAKKTDLSTMNDIDILGKSKIDILNMRRRDGFVAQLLTAKYVRKPYVKPTQNE